MRIKGVLRIISSIIFISSFTVHFIFPVIFMEQVWIVV